MRTIRQTVSEHYGIGLEGAPKKMTSTPTCLTDRLATMDFARRLAALRREQNLTQQVLADRVGIHVSQLRRYEAGTNQPTLDVLRNLALALSVSTDALVFDDTERGPQNATLRLRMEALDHLDPDEQSAVMAMIEGALLRHQARQLGLNQPAAS